ncbi:MAG: GNAT family N-acetyltransferase [Spirochaetales bacterium]|nr:GNAT family N-acetyltransferase [Spirochaetales bacterium]
MGWKIAGRTSYPEIKDFLLAREWSCASFSDRFKRMHSISLKQKEHCIIIINKDTHPQRIREAVMFTQYGLILPVLESNPPSGEVSLNGILQCLGDYMKKLHSVMGLMEHVVTIERILGDKPSEKVDYYLMTAAPHEAKIPERIDIPYITIRRARIRDAGLLYPLQKQYELEEVFLNPARFKPSGCLAHLKRNLGTEINYLAEINGIPIAKAGTNAQGFLVDQIGGVFTQKEFRNRGIGYAIMARLLNDIFKKHKLATLFVKKNNTPAITLYRKIGFSIRENFRINYYY